MGVADPLLFVVGPGISEVEFGNRLPISDEAGQVVRNALAEVGIDPARCIFGNTVKCHPPGDSFDSLEHKAAIKKCQAYLRQDIAAVNTPVLLLGEGPLRVLRQDGKTKLGGFRGLWFKGWDRECFSVGHPESSDAAKFASDISRMADRMQGREAAFEPQLEIYESPAAAEALLRKLGQPDHPHWVFDIEAYDAVEFPSRKEVAVDPCHPDWRLRGIAFAWAKDKGAYVDCKGWTAEQASPYLSLAFCSDVSKGAFHGNYDEECVVYNGFTPEVRYRESDGMLAMIALGDGTHESLKLEKAVVDILKRPQYWSLFDKEKMRDADIKLVAQGSVGDACFTWELIEILHVRLERSEYLEWGNQ